MENVSPFRPLEDWISYVLGIEALLFSWGHIYSLNGTRIQKTCIFTLSAAVQGVRDRRVYGYSVRACLLEDPGEASCHLGVNKVFFEGTGRWSCVSHSLM